ncbi:hypothetical protein EMCRGX_G011511 [Ephydatia muelleri]
MAAADVVVVFAMVVFAVMVFAVVVVLAVDIFTSDKQASQADKQCIDEQQWYGEFEPSVSDEESEYDREDFTDSDNPTLEECFEYLELEYSSTGNYSPFPSKIIALLYLLVHSPHPVGEKTLSFVWFILKQMGISVPSLASVKAFKLPNIVTPVKHLSSNGLPFYSIPLQSIIAQCLGRTDVSHSLIREMYHGSVWNTDTRFLAPMVKLSNGKSIFLRDCVYLNLAELGSVVGVVVKFFQEASSSCCDVFAEIEILLDLKQFQIMTTRTENPDIVCALRSKEEALQQMAVIKSQRTEQEKIEMRKSFGLREDENPLLHVSIPADLYQCIPVEILHTKLLGTCKHILQNIMPEFSPKIRKEILARIKAFNTSGFSTKLYGNASKCSCNLSELQLVSTGRHATTLNQLLQCGIPYNIMLGSVRLTDQVIEHHAIMSQQKCLVNSGDYIELGTPQCDMLYGILLAVFKLQDGAVVCLIQGFQKLQSQDGARPFVNEYDCPLLELTRTIFSTPGRNILRAVSVVHECHIVRGDRCLKDYGFRLSQARVDSAEVKKKGAKQRAKYLQVRDDVLESARASYKADPEKKQTAEREGYHADPEKIRSAKRERYHADPEKKRSAKRESYEADPAKKQTEEREWYHADPEKKRSAERKRYWEGPECARLAKRVRYSLYEPKDIVLSELAQKVCTRSAHAAVSKVSADAVLQKVLNVRRKKAGEFLKDVPAINAIKLEDSHLLEGLGAIPVDLNGRCVVAEEIGDRHLIRMRPLKWKCTNECRLLTSGEMEAVLGTKLLFQKNMEDLRAGLDNLLFNS